MSFQSFFGMHGKRRFSGFLGEKALPAWFDLSFISSESLIPLISVQSLFWHARKTRIFRISWTLACCLVRLEFYQRSCFMCIYHSLMSLISFQSLFWHARKTRIFRISRTQASCLVRLEFYQRSCFMCIYHSLMSLISFQSFFGMHGKRGFSGFLGDKALPWFDLSFISIDFSLINFRHIIRAYLQRKH